MIIYFSCVRGTGHSKTNFNIFYHLFSHYCIFYKIKKGANATPFNINSSKNLVPVMFWLIWSINRNAQIFSLVSTQNGEFYSQLFQMQAGNFFVEIFR